MMLSEHQCAEQTMHTPFLFYVCTLHNRVVTGGAAGQAWEVPLPSGKACISMSIDDAELSPVVDMFPEQSVVLLMQAHGVLDHHRLTRCVVHHTIKVGHVTQAVTPKLQAVGQKHNNTNPVGSGTVRQGFGFSTSYACSNAASAHGSMNQKHLRHHAALVESMLAAAPAAAGSVALDASSSS